MIFRKPAADLGAARRNPEALLLLAAGCCLLMRSGGSVFKKTSQDSIRRHRPRASRRFPARLAAPSFVKRPRRIVSRRRCRGGVRIGYQRSGFGCGQLVHGGGGGLRARRWPQRVGTHLSSDAASPIDSGIRHEPRAARAAVGGGHGRARGRGRSRGRVSDDRDRGPHIGRRPARA